MPNLNNFVYRIDYDPETSEEDGFDAQSHETAYPGEDGMDVDSGPEFGDQSLSRVTCFARGQYCGS